MGPRGIIYCLLWCVLAAPTLLAEDHNPGGGDPGKGNQTNSENKTAKSNETDGKKDGAEPDHDQVLKDITQAVNDGKGGPELDKAEAALNNRLNNVRNSIADLEKQINEEKASATPNADRIAALEAERTQLQNQLSELEKSASSVKLAREQLATRAADIAARQEPVDPPPQNPSDDLASALSTPAPRAPAPPDSPPPAPEGHKDVAGGSTGATPRTTNGTPYTTSLGGRSEPLTPIPLRSADIGGRTPDPFGDPARISAVKPQSGGGFGYLTSTAPPPAAIETLDPDFFKATEKQTPSASSFENVPTRSLASSSPPTVPKSSPDSRNGDSVAINVPEAPTSRGISSNAISTVPVNTTTTASVSGTPSFDTPVTSEKNANLGSTREIYAPISPTVATAKSSEASAASDWTPPQAYSPTVAVNYGERGIIPGIRVEAGPEITSSKGNSRVDTSGIIPQGKSADISAPKLVAAQTALPQEPYFSPVLAAKSSAQEPPANNGGLPTALALGLVSPKAAQGQQADETSLTSAEISLIMADRAARFAGKALVTSRAAAAPRPSRSQDFSDFRRDLNGTTAANQLVY